MSWNGVRRSPLQLSEKRLSGYKGSKPTFVPYLTYSFRIADVHSQHLWTVIYCAGERFQMLPRGTSLTFYFSQQCPLCTPYWFRTNRAPRELSPPMRRPFNQPTYLCVPGPPIGPPLTEALLVLPTSLCVTSAVNSSARNNQRLFLAESCHWVEMGCPSRWPTKGTQSNHQQQERGPAYVTGSRGWT